MNLSLILTILFAQVTTSLSNVIPAFQKESAQTNEEGTVQKRRPRVPRYEHYRCPSYNRDSVREHLNSLNLGDTEDEEEAMKLVRTKCVDDRLHCIFYDYRGYSQTKGDLNESFFDASVQSVNLSRLRALLAKKKHLLLSPEQKSKIMKLALAVCKDALDTGAFGEIFRLLLSANFYPKNGIWPQTYQIDDIKYPLINVLRDPFLFLPFIDYDGNVFAKEQKVNYVVKLIREKEYGLARTALCLGFNPSVGLTARNALDFALDHRNLTPDQEEKRRELVRMLTDDFGMKQSITIENFEHICKRKNWKGAVELVRLNQMTLQKNISLIGIALKYGNVHLVNTAINIYVDELSDEQVAFDLTCYSPESVADLNTRLLLEQAVERARTLKNLNN